VLISSDKTQLTDFGGKTAYPVYLTIGNIPKEIRRKPSHRAQVLLAYLPCTRLEHVTNKAARRRMVANLYHSCLGRILEPLRKAGMDGIQMFRGDGVCHRCHPILSCLPMDYPEQTLTTCVKTGLCPCCPIPRDEIGEGGNQYRVRDLNEVLEALSKADEDPSNFKKACEEAGIRPVLHPFWERLPYTHIFRSITPDVLHQLYQGVIRHLVFWLKGCCGNTEIDARCRRLPPNHNTRLFIKGISSLSRVTGKEHAQIASILLGLVIGIRLPGGRSSLRLIRAVRGLLDFLYLAQYPMHTTDTLRLLRDALKRFHDNKDIFIDLGLRDHFQIPKLHFLDHYLMYIELYGTTDNFNTEYTERLHIDYAKEAWDATNRKDELPQMTRWLERHEKIIRHAKFIKWRTGHQPDRPDRPNPGILYRRQLQMTKHPSKKNVCFDTLIHEYGATDFRNALARFIANLKYPHLVGRQLNRPMSEIRFRFDAVPVFHKIKFTSYDPYAVGGAKETVVDSIHVQPVRKDKRNRNVPPRFDTAVINEGNGQETGVTGNLIFLFSISILLTPPAQGIELAKFEWYFRCLIMSSTNYFHHI
jgi:Plavaka transposase